MNCQKTNSWCEGWVACWQNRRSALNSGAKSAKEPEGWSAKGGVGQWGGVTVVGIGIFQPKVEEKEDYVTREYWISRKMDWYSLLSKQYIH